MRWSIAGVEPGRRRVVRSGLWSRKSSQDYPMVDSRTVNFPTVEAPSGREADSDVAIECAFSPARESKMVAKSNKEEHDKVAKRTLKRRRLSVDVMSKLAEKQNLINAFGKESCELVKYFNEVLVWKLGSVDEKCGSLSASMACMLEGSNLPFSRLANEIYEKLKAYESVTLASVQRDVHFISSRLCYGMDSGNADFFEDESESSLWCWEFDTVSSELRSHLPRVRDMKLLPKNRCKLSKYLRKGREKVRERITAVNEILSVLRAPENQGNCAAQILRASEKLNKTTSLEGICLLVQKLTKKNEDEISKMESKTKEVEQLETNERSIKKRMKRHDHYVQKEESQNERELKLQQIKAEKAERRHKKEQAEAKKLLCIQKQASFMERFLKIKNGSHTEKLVDCQHSLLGYVGNNCNVVGSTTVQMDSAFCQKESLNILDLKKSHVASWHKLRHPNKYKHWGIRRKPRTKFINELKILGSLSGPEGSGASQARKSGKAFTELKSHEKADNTISMDEIDEHFRTNQSCYESLDNDCIASHDTLLPKKNFKLLQFDKSYRPAYYGSWSKKSVVVGPRRPFAKDVDLDYEFDSDAEWEEEEPGESLSECDKDDEEDSKEHDEVESEDSFLAPDGYRSEQEVRCIQSNPNTMVKLVESLHKKFPDISKTKLRNKVRETCEFVNNRWQVRKDVLDKLGISGTSPDKGGHPKGIPTFFSPQQCPAPISEVMDFPNYSPQIRPKHGVVAVEDPNHDIQETSP